MKPYVTYPFQLFSCIVMLVAFLWLTIGTSFLSVEQQKKLHNETSSRSNADDTEKDAAPFENAKEEKTETSPNTFSEEYLREDTDHFDYTDAPLKHNKCHIANAFVAYYGESASQPPETLFC
jgi:hypothetical protein